MKGCRGGAPVLAAGMVCGPYRVLEVLPGTTYTAQCVCKCGCGREALMRSYDLKKFLRGFTRNRDCIRKDSAVTQSRIAVGLTHFQKRVPADEVTGNRSQCRDAFRAGD